jgi:hypothetical protein
VNIKAWTHEKMDSVGELRSLSCHVVVTLEKTTAEGSREICSDSIVLEKEKLSFNII